MQPDLRNQFNRASLKEDETAIQFTARFKGYFDQSLKKDGADDTAEGVKDLILHPQFVKSCPDDLVTRLKMDKVKKLEDIKRNG